MKKYISFLITFTMLAALITLPSYAWSTHTKTIPSVRITVNLNDISVGDELSYSAESYITVPDNAYYELDDAEWIDEIYSLKVGDQPRMRVYLSAIPKETSGSHYDTIWLFQSSYNSSNVHINKGEFISADRRDSGYGLEVTLRINAINGQFNEPNDVYWTDSRGTGRWNVDENDSGYYDIVCYRGSTAVKKLFAYHGNSYNFYPYMTKEGDYSFKVRTVAAPEGKGKNSDWVESGGLYIDKNNVSDGTGQTTADEHGGGAAGGSALPYISGNNYPDGTGNANVAGWLNDGGYVYFRYPNGEFARDGWLKLDDKWYMFDASGRRLTGWQQNKYKTWFYMDPTTGVMRTGWLLDNGKWYFLNTSKDNYEGCMVRGWWTWNGQKYYFNESGVMVTGWYQVDGKFYYFYPQGSTVGTYGYMATNARIGDFTVGADGAWVP
ncbi:MAG: N-acetylmuramoyl-L-alanine amidase family protein [Lachnospiraceae bacterium]|jgi:hypothetical protein|nr:N-acetylmuramoyl-L-alanine amidase family protein [Lachnospiraceae bacterium]